jgi:hypothetical protein
VQERRFRERCAALPVHRPKHTSFSNQSTQKRTSPAIWKDKLADTSFAAGEDDAMLIWGFARKVRPPSTPDTTTSEKVISLGAVFKK